MHPSTRTPAARGAAAAPARPHNSARPPRRISTLSILVLGLLIVAAAVAWSVGPYREWQETTERVAAQEQQVALIESQNASLAAEVDRLQRSQGYVEALAREDLMVGRPGEEVFVVSGVPTTEVASPSAPRPDEPGPVQRLVTTLRELF